MCTGDLCRIARQAGLFVLFSVIVVVLPAITITPRDLLNEHVIVESLVRCLQITDVWEETLQAQFNNTASSSSSFSSILEKKKQNSTR